ncbi:MAG: hypothetical protein RI894_831 [Bacteroidota bacterium]|jgi:hypothetical protein
MKNKHSLKTVAPATLRELPEATPIAKPRIDWLSWLYSFILIVLFSVQYNFVFDSKVSAVGDNADYYILAKSLADNHGYRTMNEIGTPLHNHFPPGYPFFLSIIMRFFTTEYVHLVAINGVFLFVALGIGLKLFYDATQNKHISLVVAILCLFNYHLLTYSTNLLSEIPFLFTSMAAIWVFIRLDSTKNSFKNPYSYLFLGLIVSSFYIRSAGIALVASFAITLISKKNWKMALFTIIGFIMLVLPWQIRSAAIGGDSYFNQLVHKDGNVSLPVLSISDFTLRFWSNILRYITREIPSLLFPWTEKPNFIGISWQEFIWTIPLVLVIGFGLFRLKQHRTLFASLTACTFFIVLLWPEIWFGIRFILPLAPLLLLFLVNGIYELGQWLFSKLQWQANFINTVAWGFIPLLILPKLYYFEHITVGDEQKRLLVALSVSAAHIIAEDKDLNIVHSYYEVAKWCKTNLPKDALVLCRKPSLFYLFAEKHTVPLASFTFTDKEMKTLSDTVRANRYIAFLKEKKVDYVLIDLLSYPETQKFFYPVMRIFPRKFPIVYQSAYPISYLVKFEP